MAKKYPLAKRGTMAEAAGVKLDDEAETITLTNPATGKSVTLTPEQMKRAAGRIKPVQSHLPGMEPVTIPEVEEAAKAFAEAKEDQADAAEIAKNREEALIKKMRAHEIRFYHKNGIRIEISETEKAKVKEDQKRPKRDERRHPNATE